MYDSQGRSNGLATYNGRNGLQPAEILDHTGTPYRQQYRNSGAYNYNDGFAIPQILHFTGILQSAWKQYYPLKDQSKVIGDEFHLVMMRQPHIMALLRERWRAVRKLKWHLEVDDERDPQQKAVADGMTRAIRAIPNLKKLWFEIQWKTWYGKAASQVKWEWVPMKLPGVKRVAAVPGLPELGTKTGGPKAGPEAPVGMAGLAQGDEERRVCMVTGHMPVNGDKIMYKDDHTPMIVMNASQALQLPGAVVESTPLGGRGVVLYGGWRNKFIIGQHEPMDADFYHPELADSVHGVGVRDVLAWSEWMREEWIASICTFIERWGMGVKLWYYDASDANAYTEVKKRATENSDNTNILVPVFHGQKFPGFESQDVPVAGTQVLLQLIQHMEYWQQRYLGGNTLASSHEKSGGLGGGDVAGESAEKQDDLTIEDAESLAEDLTGTDRNPGINSVMFRYTWPELQGKMRCPRFAFDVDVTSPEKRLTAVKTFLDMGGTVREDEARSLTGCSDPQEGDAVLGGQVNQAGEGNLDKGLTDGGRKPPPGPGSPNGNGKQPGGKEKPPDMVERPKPAALPGPQIKMPGALTRYAFEPVYGPEGSAGWTMYTYDPDQPRGDDGRWAIEFVPHPKQRQDETTIKVNTAALHAAWSAGEHVPGPSEVRGRREEFRTFLARKEPVQAPRVVIGPDGDVSFVDGRHRFSVLHEKGVKEISVTIPKEQEEEFKRRFGKEPGADLLGDAPPPSPREQGKLFGFGSPKEGEVGYKVSRQADPLYKPNEETDPLRLGQERSPRTKRKAEQPMLFSSQEAAVFYGEVSGNGHWITIGGHKEGDKRHGGTPVYIENGRITKGAPSLTGRKIDALKEDASEHSHRKELQQSKGYARAKFAKDAKGQGVNPKHLHQLAADFMAHDKTAVVERTGMLREARKALEEWGGHHKLIHTGRVEQGDVRGMDEVAETMNRKYPHLFDERHGHVSDQLHDLLTVGNPHEMSEEDAYEQALNELMEHKIEEEDVATPGEQFDDKGWSGGFDGRGGRDEFVRLGTAPEGGQSINNIDDTLEDGVSAFRLREDQEGPYFDSGESGDDWFEGRPVFLVKANEIGTGSDGEPLFDADSAKTTARLRIKRGSGRKWRIVEEQSEEESVPFASAALPTQYAGPTWADILASAEQVGEAQRLDSAPTSQEELPEVKEAGWRDLGTTHIVGQQPELSRPARRNMRGMEPEKAAEPEPRYPSWGDFMKHLRRR